MRMFTREQCTWITIEYAKNPSPTIAKREFVRKHNICRRQKGEYYPHHFTRVFERSKSCGIAPALYPGSQISIATPQAKQLISQEIQNLASSICQIARNLDFFLLRKELKVKPFKFHRCQELSEDHKQQCLVFCNWICNRNSSRP